MIPFVKTTHSPQLGEILQDCIQKNHLSGDGFYCRKSEEILKAYTASQKVLLTTSCTHALEMSGILLNLQPGDEVIMPSYTFVSTANAFVLRGAVPVFVDIRPDTLNIDERLIEAAITSRTRAIVVVHYGGLGCEMDAILELANRHGITVIEDNAHGLFGKYKGRMLGSFGQLSTLSFHETKNISCGEGGAICINHEGLVERAEILREKGTNRARFFRGQIDKYTWVDMGSSWVLSEVLGAMLYSQLQYADFLQGRRKDIWNRYQQAFAPLAEQYGYEVPQVPDYCEIPWHVYYLKLQTLDQRTQMIEFFKKRQISAVFHYIPLHRSSYYQEMNQNSPSLPVTEQVSDTLLRLPLYAGLEVAQQDKIIESLYDFYKQ